MKELAKSFLGGILFTIILVVVIPVITSVYLQPMIEDEVNNIAISIVSSSLIISVIMLLITIIFMLLLGGGAILRNFGIAGVFGLIAAYWLLGNPYGAIMPVITLILVAFAKYLWNNHVKKKVVDPLAKKIKRKDRRKEKRKNKKKKK